MQLSSPLKIACKYAVFGILWIFFSDYAVAFLDVPAPVLQTIKGSLFVLASAALIYFLVKRDFDHIMTYKQELEKSRSLLQDTQQLSKTGGWEYDIASGRMDWTDEAFSILNIDQQSAPKSLEQYVAFYHPEDQNILAQSFSRAILRLRPEVPVILCTGFQDRTSGDSDDDRGITRYLAKPVHLRDLAAALRQVLA